MFEGRVFATTANVTFQKKLPVLKLILFTQIFTGKRYYQKIIEPYSGRAFWGSQRCWICIYMTTSSFFSLVWHFCCIKQLLQITTSFICFCHSDFSKQEFKANVDDLGKYKDGTIQMTYWWRHNNLLIKLTNKFYCIKFPQNWYQT